MLLHPDFLISLRLLLKAKFAWVAFAFFLVVALSALLSAYFGGRQPITVALDVGISVIRLLLPLALVLMAQELISRELERRYYLNSLTYPRGRSAFLFGRFAALLVLLLVLLIFMGVSLLALVGLLSGVYMQATPVSMGAPYLIVVAFIALDLLVLTALAALLAVVASTPSFVLVGTFGFMLVARSYGSIVELLGRNDGLVSNAESYRVSLGMLGYLMPDLGALDVRMVSLYGKSAFLPTDWPLLVLSNLSYAIALLALAVWALKRKCFA